MGGLGMKYYIEKDIENRVICKGITIDESVLNVGQIEVTESEFNAIEQYKPVAEEIIPIPTFEERLSATEEAITFFNGGVICITFILNQWILGRYTQIQVQNCVTKGYITQEQADTILTTPQL